MIETGGVFQMPRQEVNEGQKHGYIGEESGEVRVVEPREAGDSNVVPSLEVAQLQVDAAELALKRAQKTLGEAKVAASRKRGEEQAGTTEKPLVGSTATPGPAKSTAPSGASTPTTSTPPASGTSSQTPPAT